MKRQNGFTLVELLVVITIIGMLVALLMPAVMSARESGRKAQCMNNLNQLGKAALMHESTHTWFPTGGWEWWWAGDPDRGVAERQPGGWTYNILPFMELQALHDKGLGLTGSARQAALAAASQTQLQGFICPTRRPVQQYPNPTYFECNSLSTITTSARTDYAANGGTVLTNPSGQSIFWTSCPATGDPTFADGTVNGTVVTPYQFPSTVGFDGIMFTVSRVTHPQISDGTAFTLMFSEKYLNPVNYLTGLEPTDNNPIFGGFDWDWTRWGADNTGANRPPMCDRKGISNNYAFGSAHVDGLNVVTCDGSGHWINYSIDPTTFFDLCSRNDGMSLNDTKLAW